MNSRGLIRFWHTLRLRDAAEFGRYRDIAGIDQAAPIEPDCERAQPSAGRAFKSSKLRAESCGTAV
jgi:hypothetical protein